MDIKQVLNADTLKAISDATGIDAGDVAKVMVDVLPLLLSGAAKQNSDASTAAGFLEALLEHGSKDSTDLSKFIKNIDVEDGAKIVKHLLGAEESKDVEKAAKATGLDKKKILKIMAVAAPIIMNQIGKSAKKDSKKSAKEADSDFGDVVTSIIKNVDANDVAKIIKAFA